MNDWRALPFAPSPGTPLCDVGDIPEGGAKEISFGEGKDAFGVVQMLQSVLAKRYTAGHF